MLFAVQRHGPHQHRPICATKYPGRVPDV